MMPAYVRALIAEINGKCPPTPPTTIYLGGGTPTLLPLPFMQSFLMSLREVFSWREIPSTLEFTTETNPKIADEVYLAALHDLGVNRLSIGVQSFNDKLLKKLGRLHDATDAKNAIVTAKRAGFANINIDLMYALPDQTVNDLRRDIETALTLDIPHIAVYGLEIEEGTPFAAMTQKHLLNLPNDDEAESMYDLLTDLLTKNGYNRYEISNYARDNFVSRHNLGYWHFRPYIGVGVAAHSFWSGERYANSRNVSEYLNAMERKDFWGVAEAGRSVSTAMAEYCFTALRTAEGIDPEDFLRRFHRPLSEVYGAIIDKFRRQEAIKKDKVALTSLGMKYGNLIFAEFLA